MAKRLADLFKVGTTVVIEDGQDKVEIWLQKLIPNESSQAIDRASAKRARFLTVKKLPDDADEVLLQWEEMERLYPDKEALRYVAAASELAQTAESVLAELSAEEEWSKDDYLAGLKAAWETDDIAKKIEEGTEDPELLRVKAELDRFNEQVRAEYDKREGRIFRDLDGQGEKALREKAFEVFVDGQADGIWLREYRDCQIYYGTREPHDHQKLYFQSRDEVSTLAFEVIKPLLEAYQELEVSPDEGKD